LRRKIGRFPPGTGHISHFQGPPLPGFRHICNVSASWPTISASEIPSCCQRKTSDCSWSRCFFLLCSQCGYGLLLPRSSHRLGFSVLHRLRHTPTDNAAHGAGHGSLCTGPQSTSSFPVPETCGESARTFPSWVEETEPTTYAKLHSVGRIPADISDSVESEDLPRQSRSAVSGNRIGGMLR
jgi:hypothetical protein